MLATFVGSFLFSLVGIIALTTGAYGDDLLALADAVREAGRPMVEATRFPSEPMATGAGRETARRGHLRVLTSE